MGCGLVGWVGVHLAGQSHEGGILTVSNIIACRQAFCKNVLGGKRETKTTSSEREEKRLFRN